MLAKIKALDEAILLDLNGFFLRHGGFLIRFLAQYLIYSLPVILIVLWFWSKQAKKIALRALFAVILAWPILANLIGHLINRSRPFETSGVQELFFHRPTYSFPSDHAAALFAVSFSFWFSGYKKLSGVMFAIAVIVSFFRIATGIHFPSDILGGLVLGLISAYLIFLFDRPLELIYNFILKIMARLRLA